MRRTAAAAAQTRARIVAAGISRSSTDGLFGLTLGPLAADLDMSKAGVIGPFGSRTELQLAVLARAGEMFTAAVILPSGHVPAGVSRLRAVVESWCDYLANSPFPNGCFVTAASCELDGRPGELRDALRQLVVRWRAFLREQIATARADGDLAPDTDPDELVSMLNGLAMTANQELQLLGDRRAARRAKRAMLGALAASTD